jgi:dCTP deaminase
MLLTHEEIHKIVQNLSQRELENPEGAEVDLRIGEVHRISGGEAFIEADGPAGQGLRSGFETELVMAYKADSDTQDKLTIKPGEYFLLKTIEEVKLPLNVVGDFRPRTSLFRAGLNLITSIGAPGYEGGLVFGVANIGSLPVTLQMGARFCRAIFHQVDGEGVAYRGQNQGGRITAAGTEQQV